MSSAINEREHRVAQQEIEVRHERRKYEQAVEAYRWGTRRIAASARDEIAKLRFERDEARMRLEREEEQLAFLKAERDRGFSD